MGQPLPHLTSCVKSNLVGDFEPASKQIALP